MNKRLALVLVLAIVPLGMRAAHAPAPAAKAAFERAQAMDKNKQPAEALTAFIQAIEADPEFLAAHDGLVKARLHLRDAAYARKDLNRKVELEQINRSIDAKYRAWEQRFPDSVGILYGMATQLYDRHDAAARPYLLKWAARDPNNAKVYEMLGVDSLIAGDNRAAVEYLRKASTLEPANAQYAYAYARALDPPQREVEILDVIKRFPESESSAEALFLLSVEAPTDAQRVGYLEQLRGQFPPEKSEWSAEGMSELFDAYLRIDPAKGVKLARQMQAGKSSRKWDGQLALAQTYVEVNKRVIAGKAREALALLDKLKFDPDSSNIALLVRLRAQVMTQAGQVQAAYDNLLKQQAKLPERETLAWLENTGRQLNKTPARVRSELEGVRTAGAKNAPPFELEQYASDDTVSLAKLRGKVVLLTFWFPACSWCRLEFPHFEGALQQLHTRDVVYLGVNIARDEDAYVLPMIEKMKYSFTPLKGTEAVSGSQAGYKVRGTPANFLIDRSGRIVYSGFVAEDARGELQVRRMIESVL